MAKVKLSKLKNVAKGAVKPVLRTVKWSVEVTEDNISELVEMLEQELEISESVELEADVYVKKLSFGSLTEIAKAYEWNIDKEDIKKSTLKSIDIQRLKAAQLMGSVCENEKGTPMFKNIGQVMDTQPSLIDALFDVADQVNNFEGKSQKKSSTESESGSSSSSTELAEKQ